MCAVAWYTSCTLSNTKCSHTWLTGLGKLVVISISNAIHHTLNTASQWSEASILPTTKNATATINTNAAIAVEVATGTSIKAVVAHCQNSTRFTLCMG